MTDKYAHQKRYLKIRYATDEAYRSNRQKQMRQYHAARYAGDAVFREHEQLAQRQRYAAEAALQIIKYLFEEPPARVCRAARSMDARLLNFCRQFVAGSAKPTYPQASWGLGHAHT